MNSGFPDRVYTEDEVEKARKLVEAGHKHQLTIEGSPYFKEEVEKALKHVKTAEFYDFLRTYIKQIVEIDGFSQLRESEAAIWANLHLLKNLVEAAGFFIQKAWQMKEFLEGKLYYGGAAEARSIEKNLEFLRTLKSKSNDYSVKDECDRLLRRWADSTFVF
ncbi:MAG: hypothetical protein NWE78_08585 [Candidatus Bathyarchaeota archaeon]|nr:hypothetical protein [Candidatus Bathyarchaeota archaeon]